MTLNLFELISNISRYDVFLLLSLNTYFPTLLFVTPRTREIEGKMSAFAVINCQVVDATETERIP